MQRADILSIDAKLKKNIKTGYLLDNSNINVLKGANNTNSSNTYWL